MKFASLVISLEMAQNLFDNGIRNESCFYWYQEKAPEGKTLFETGISQKTMPWKLHISRPSKGNRNIYKELPAYTSQELGEMMPGFIKKDGNVYYPRFYRTEKKEWQYCYEDQNMKTIANSLGKTEAEARAALLNFILWNKFINLTDTLIQ